MKSVLYTCPFVPAEWIAACGLDPMRMTPERAGEGMPAGVCPFAAAFIHAASTTNACAIIVTTVCDQMSRSAEIIEARCETPVFLMNVPATWRTEEAAKLYRDELARLGRFLEDLGGAKPTPEQLIETMLHYDSLRAKRRADDETARPKGLPLILAGGPLRSTDIEIFDLIEQAGGTVVLDATAGGEMTLPAPFDRARLASDPAGELADAYFARIPHAMRRPDNQLHEYLNRELTARGARGVIYRRYQWCDTWHGEAGRLKDSLPAPVLDLVAGDDESDRAHVLTRIQAFVEMLK
ncbi:MAG: 2-hydroxyacyl-CoA dehydratase [Phycisphaerae bacterium]|nr:2-hydroxyacyl-CoA dehydratase [Phycisphaerae bacterium]